MCVVTETFTITDRTLKLVIAAFVTFFFETPQYGLIATLVVVCILLAVTVAHRPCRDLVVVNLARVIVYLLSIWSLIASLIASEAVSDPTTNYFPVHTLVLCPVFLCASLTFPLLLYSGMQTIFLFVGWFVILVAGLILFNFRHRFAASVAGTCLQPIGVWLEDVQVPLCFFFFLLSSSPTPELGCGCDVGCVDFASQRNPCQFCSHRVKVAEMSAHLQKHHAGLEVCCLRSSSSQYDLFVSYFSLLFSCFALG